MAVVLFTASCSKSFLPQYTFTGTCSVSDEGVVDAQTAITGTAGSAACSLNDLRFEWSIDDYGIRAVVENRSSSPVEIAWTAGSFRPPAGESVGVITATGSKGTGPVLRSEISPGQRLAASVFPDGYSEQAQNMWLMTKPIFDPPGHRVGKAQGEIEAIAAPAVGQSIALTLPVRGSGGERMYTFEFTVAKVGGAERHLI